MLNENMASVPDDAALLLLDVVVAARRGASVAEVLRAGLATYEKGLVRATEAGTESGLDPRWIRPTWCGCSPCCRSVASSPRRSVPRPRRLTPMTASSTCCFARRAPRPRTNRRPPSPRSGRERAPSSAPRVAEQVVEAVGAGYSLRQVGAAAGVSHERVRQMLHDTAP